MAARRWARLVGLGVSAVLATAAATATAGTAAATPPATPPAASPATSPATSIGFGFRAAGYEIHDIDRGTYPYARSTPVARTDPEPHDATGVRMARVGGRLVNHPVAQAAYGLVNLESYRATGDAFYLRRAVLQAARLTAGAKRVGGAWLLPYPFDFDPHGLTDERLHAPWYSAMAQGQALSLFVRLAETTGEARWRAAADATFASFLRRRGAASPWIVSVDAAGFLWLEEYAGGQGDHTFNGHMFGAWGLWDYWRLTQDARAAQLWDGALTTVVGYAPQLRQPGWLSSYCLAHPWSAVDTYHLIHIGQLASLYAMSHAPVLARLSETFSADYPDPKVRGTVRFAPGRYTAYRFDPGGVVTAATTRTLAQRSSAPIDARTRVQGHGGIWYRVTAGAFKGYYVQERPGTVYLAGRYLTASWSPERPGVLPAGHAVTGWTFAADGQVTDTRTLPADTTAAPVTVSRTALWNGVRLALVATGPLAGYWLPVTQVSFG